MEKIQYCVYQIPGEELAEYSSKTFHYKREVLARIWATTVVVRWLQSQQTGDAQGRSFNIVKLFSHYHLSVENRDAPREETGDETNTTHSDMARLRNHRQLDASISSLTPSCA
jgi:hypothetical protein